MRDILNNLRKNILCKKTRNKMLSAYLSNEYFGFDSNLHASSCIKCQVSGKRYKAFKEELDNELQKNVEVPTDFASKVMSSTNRLGSHRPSRKHHKIISTRARTSQLSARFRSKFIKSC